MQLCISKKALSNGYNPAVMQASELNIYREIPTFFELAWERYLYNCSDPIFAEAGNTL